MSQVNCLTVNDNPPKKMEDEYGIEIRDTGVPAVFDACCKKWAIKALVEMGGHTNILRLQNCAEPELLRYLGIHANLEESYEQTLVLNAVKEKYKELVNPNQLMPVNTTLNKNIDWLGKQLGLSENDQKILLLCVLEKHNIFLKQSLAAIGEMKESKLMSVVSILLDIPLRCVYDAFAEHGLLTRTGLLTTITYLDSLDFGSKVDLISGLAERLMEEQTDFFDIFKHNFVAAPIPSLKIEDYAHVSNKVENAVHLLKTAIKEKRIGTNILLFSKPGTGKSELARVIAEEVGADAFEVSVGGRPGERYSNVNRLSAYMLSQTILAKSPNKLIIFDECEDISTKCDDEDQFMKPRRSSGKGMKGAMNQLLETNNVPCIFITNDLGCFQDPAFLRRIDICIQLEIPPLSVRVDMLKTFTTGMQVSEEWCKQTASNESISPAMMSKAVNVANAIQASSKNSLAEQVLSELLDSSLKAQSIQVKPKKSQSNALNYNLDYVNTDVNLKEITESLKTHACARILLYGVSGSGKSAYALHLAESIGKRAIIKQASDIFSKYLGDTEKCIAQMFSEAKEESAVLILDEADSYLRDRTQGLKSFEITIVNEMLTQMEAFEGIFIATTNLIDFICPSAMRRFDLKAKFDYLKPNDAITVFNETCKLLNVEPYLADDVSARQLTQLSPGDFSVVFRQAKFKKITTYQQVLKILEQEKSIKNLTLNSKMGFLTN